MTTFLNALRPLLRDTARLTIQVQPAAGGMKITLIPQLAGIEIETSDEALAALQAALSQPVTTTIPAGVDADATLGAALAELAGMRSPVLDSLADYRESLRSAAQAAKAKQADAATKAKGGKATPSAKPASSSAPPVAPHVEDSADADDEAGADATQPEVAPVTAAVAPAIDLFT